MEYFSSQVARQEEKEKVFLWGSSLAERSEVFLSSKKTDTYFIRSAEISRIQKLCTLLIAVK